MQLFGLQNFFISVQIANFILYCIHYLTYSLCTHAIAQQYEVLIALELAFFNRSHVKHTDAVKTPFCFLFLTYIMNTFILRFKPFQNGTSQAVYNLAINVKHIWWHLRSHFFMKMFLYFITILKRKFLNGQVIF